MPWLSEEEWRGKSAIRKLQEKDGEDTEEREEKKRRVCMLRLICVSWSMTTLRA